MIRISSEVFIFCLWTDWMYIDRGLHGGSSQKSLLACGDAKKSINRLKHHLPKWKAISLFLPPTIFDKTSYLSHYMQKKRVAWHPKERLPIKLAVIRSKNIEVYTSFSNSIQGNGQSWTNETSVSSLLQTTRCDKTPHLSHDALKKCVAWHPR